MNSARFRAGLFVLGLGAALAGCATLARRSAPDYAALDQVAAEQDFIDRIWSGAGQVVVGRLQLPPNAQVASRIPFRSDGSYCTALYPGRRLTFYAHGYDPLEIVAKNRLAPRLWDAGTQPLVPASAADRRRVQFSAAFPAARSDSPSILATLLLRNRDSLWHDDGNRCGAAISVVAETKTFAAGQTVEFDDLSRLPYVVVLTAPGHVKQERAIAPEQSGTIDLGAVALEPAPRFRLTYKVRIRHGGGPWQEDGAVHSADVICNGDAEFRFTRERDGLGNRLELRLQPDGQAVVASFFYHKNDSFHDLGPAAPDALPGWDDMPPAPGTGAVRLPLRDGHLHSFAVDDVNGTDVRLLFRADAN
jgi:hypothetical protein